MRKILVVVALIAIIRTIIVTSASAQTEVINQNAVMSRLQVRICALDVNDSRQILQVVLENPTSININWDIPIAVADTSVACTQGKDPVTGRCVEEPGAGPVYHSWYGGFNSVAHGLRPKSSVVLQSDVGSYEWWFDTSFYGNPEYFFRRTLHVIVNAWMDTNSPGNYTVHYYSQPGPRGIAFYASYNYPKMCHLVLPGLP